MDHRPTLPRTPVSRSVLAALCALVLVAASAAADRPTVTVEAPAVGCPAIAGAFVALLDEAEGRVAVRVSFTDGGYFSASDKAEVGWVVTAPAEPGLLEDPPFGIRSAGVTSARLP